MVSNEKIKTSVEPALQEWLKSSLSFLKENLVKEKHSFWHSGRIDKENSSIVTEPVPISFIESASLTKAIFSDSQKYLKVVNEFRVDGLIRKHTEGNEIKFFYFQETIDHDEILEWILRKYLSKNSNQFEYNEETFQTVFADVKSFFESDELILRGWSTVVNCGSEDDLRIDLDSSEGNLSVRNIGLNEIQELFASIELLGEAYRTIPNQIPSLNSGVWNTVADFTVRREKKFVLNDQAPTIDINGLRDYSNFIRTINQVETCLRLICPRWLGLGPIFVWVENAPFTKQSQHKVNRTWDDQLLARMELDPHRDSSPNYLDRDVTEKLGSKWKSLRLIEEKRYDIAVSRFSSSCDRSRAEDRLIDQMISFEALFLSNIQDELKFRLATRVASLIGNSSDQKKELFNLMRKAYDLRSDIVHGEKCDFEKLQKIVSQTENVLRIAINRILDNKLFDEIKRNEYWDNLLFP